MLKTTALDDNFRLLYHWQSLAYDIVKNAILQTILISRFKLLNYIKYSYYKNVNLSLEKSLMYLNGLENE